MTRRESRSFTVEVRKGQKRAQTAFTAEQPQANSSHGGVGSHEDMFRRAEAALFERTPQPHQGGGEDHKHPETSNNPNTGGGDFSHTATLTTAAQNAAPTKGRILETLDQADPLESLMAERVEATRRGRKPGSKNKPKVLPHTVAASSTEPAALPQRQAMPPAARKAAISTPVFTAPEPTLGGGRESLRVAALHTSGEKFSTHQRGLIRGRYVTGSELRPGERWKRRLRYG